MASSDEERVVRAALAAVAELPSDSVERLGDEHVFTLLASATTEAIKLKFDTVPEPATVETFVESLRARFPDGAELIRLGPAEAIVKSAFGDDEPLETVSADDLRTLLFLLPYAIVSEKNLQGDRLDKFVDEVLAMVEA